MDKTDIIETTERHVACEGDGETSTHPKIYLKIGATNSVTCPYCSKCFILKAEMAKASHH